MFWQTSVWTGQSGWQSTILRNQISIIGPIVKRKRSSLSLIYFLHFQKWPVATTVNHHHFHPNQPNPTRTRLLTKHFLWQGQPVSRSQAWVAFGSKHVFRNRLWLIFKMAFLPVCISTRTWIFTSAVFLHFLATVCFGVHLFWCVMLY